MNAIITKGQRYGSLTVQRQSYDEASTRWLCICSCGRPVLTEASHLTEGTRKSCGNPKCVEKESLNRAASKTLLKMSVKKPPKPKAAPKVKPAPVKIAPTLTEKEKHDAAFWKEFGTTPRDINKPIIVPGADGVELKEVDLKDRPEHSIWQSIFNRCTSPTYSLYEYYGKRGVTVEPSWKSFDRFMKDVGPMPSPDLFLVRKDVNGNYTPDNVVWAIFSPGPAARPLVITPTVPMKVFVRITEDEDEKDTRKSHPRALKQKIHAMVYQGQMRTLKEIAELAGVGYRTLYNRINLLGHSLEHAINTPVKTIRQKGTRRASSLL